MLFRSLKYLLILVLLVLSGPLCKAETFFVTLSDTSGFRTSVYASWGEKVQEVSFPFASSIMKFMHKTARVSLSDSLLNASSFRKISPSVLSVHPRVIYHTDYIPNDSLYTDFQWNLKKIQAEDAWNISAGEPFITSVTVI